MDAFLAEYREVLKYVPPKKSRGLPPVEGLLEFFFDFEAFSQGDSGPMGPMGLPGTLANIGKSSENRFSKRLRKSIFKNIVYSFFFDSEAFSQGALAPWAPWGFQEP